MVKEYREKYGEPDVIEVRQTFNDSLQAREWEEIVLRRLNAVKDERWLNKGNSGKNFKSPSGWKMTEDDKNKRRKPKSIVENYRKPKSKEHRQNISKNHCRWNKGIPTNTETREKISRSLKGRKHTQVGCIYCRIVCCIANFAKYHGDQCKEKPK